MPRSFDSVFYGAAGTDTDTGPSDDEFNRVSFLSHFDGANNGVNNAFDDGSTNNHTVTANGNATQGSFGPFARPNGEWAVDLTPSGGFLRATGAGDISGDFTIETWVFMNKDNGNYINLTYNSGGIVNVFNVYNGSVQNFLFGTSSGASQTTLEFNDTTWDAGVWTHLAMVRSSGTLKIYVNGVADATTTTAVSGNLTNLEYIGTGRGFTDTPNSRLFDGIVSNVRFSSTARYTSNFTPSTTDFTSDSDTDLLTCQSNRFVDNSSNGHAITPSGSAAVTAFGPILTSAVYDPAVNGASAFLDGTGDYLSMDGPGTLNASANWCMECFFYCNDSDPGIARIMGVNEATDADAFTLMRLRNNKYEFYSGGGSSYAYSNQIGTANYQEWAHIALTKSGTTVRAFVNGIKLWEATHNATNVIAKLITGWGYGSEYFPGYISDARFVNGSSIYTANFTPPTAPLTAITNTSQLLNMADGQAIDSAAQNNLTLFGNAKLSTGQAKFGDTSLLLDGTGDFAIAQNFEDLAGPFTIECFARADDTGTAYFWCVGVYTIELGINGNNLFTYTSAGYTNFFTGGEFTVNNWHHVALVRDTSNVIKIYLNGTASSTTLTASTTFAAGGRLLIGGEYASATSISHGWDGYIEEFRVSRFPRYTSNFTAPSEPFADKGQ